MEDERNGFLMSRPKHRPRKAPKLGLTKHEQARVERINAADRQRWENLLALNAWKPCVTSSRS